MSLLNSSTRSRFPTQGGASSASGAAARATGSVPTSSAHRAPLASSTNPLSSATLPASRAPPSVKAGSSTASPSRPHTTPRPPGSVTSEAPLQVPGRSSASNLSSSSPLPPPPKTASSVGPSPSRPLLPTAAKTSPGAAPAGGPRPPVPGAVPPGQGPRPPAAPPGRTPPASAPKPPAPASTVPASRPLPPTAVPPGPRPPAPAPAPPGPGLPVSTAPPAPLGPRPPVPSAVLPGPRPPVPASVPQGPRPPAPSAVAGPRPPVPAFVPPAVGPPVPAAVSLGPPLPPAAPPAAPAAPAYPASPAPPAASGCPAVESSAVDRLESAIVAAHQELLEAFQVAGMPSPPMHSQHSTDSITERVTRCEQRLREFCDLAKGHITARGEGSSQSSRNANPAHVQQLFEMIDGETMEHQAQLRTLVEVYSVSVLSPHPASGQLPLDYAVLQGRRQSVRTLISLQASISHCKPSSADLSAAAQRFGLDEVLRALTGWGITQEARDDLLAVAASGDSERCLQLLQMQADLNARDDTTGFSVLEWAVHHGQEEIAALLVYYGADDEAKACALRAIAVHGLYAMLLRLLDAHCDPMSRDLQGWTALDWAVTEGQETVALELLRRGGPALAQGCGRGIAALARIARNKELWQLTPLLEYEPIAAASRDFQSIVEGGDANGLQQLLLSGSFVADRPIQDGLIPLDYCLERGRSDLVVQLLRWRAQPSLASGGSSHLLARAAIQETSSIDIVQEILRAWAAIDDRGPTGVGQTAFETLVQGRYEAAAQRLLSLNADPNAASCGGSAIQHAASVSFGASSPLAIEISRQVAEAIRPPPQPPPPPPPQATSPLSPKRRVTPLGSVGGLVAPTSPKQKAKLLNAPRERLLAATSPSSRTRAARSVSSLR
eukprot:TRINITY_DN47825_c0_g1_i1.p1 TRINITY_DN47825_c0_g1~~TRINITY_DN47825_c0_g1_i1.p1  ORF type:complete len:892 (+),score=115.29 TRINITY_DN47825_c0_g1_i1:35-2710(+)